MDETVDDDKDDVSHGVLVPIAEDVSEVSTVMDDIIVELTDNVELRVMGVIVTEFLPDTDLDIDTLRLLVVDASGALEPPELLVEVEVDELVLDGTTTVVPLWVTLLPIDFVVVLAVIDDTTAPELDDPLLCITLIVARLEVVVVVDSSDGPLLPADVTKPDVRVRELLVVD